MYVIRSSLSSRLYKTWTPFPPTRMEVQDQRNMVSKPFDKETNVSHAHTQVKKTKVRIPALLLDRVS
ncbi:unnamed protein product [Dovyalis caffra]|uniref:Uncharacterized protein n=1 Tax=Dovyalis caffra TaxID=77055 RepID=A0AAV1SC25_9ROSI|nr:unnamed protein product [Dovyalis caffra]